MNFEQFCNALKSMPRSMRRIARKYILSKSRYCPITAVASTVLKKDFSVQYYSEAGYELGMSQALINKIARAADSKTSCPKTRSKMLECLKD